MPDPDEAHSRPAGTSDDAVRAVDTFTRALETVEVARGHLYQWHRLTGTGDTQLRQAIDELRGCGLDALADRVARDLSGRNVIHGRWTFQVVEEYDDDYYATWRQMEHDVREEVLGGRRHVLESEMKEDNRTHGHPQHAARPDEVT